MAIYVPFVIIFTPFLLPVILFFCSVQFFIVIWKAKTYGSSVCLIFSPGTVVIPFWGSLFLTGFTRSFFGIFIIFPYDHFSDTCLGLLPVVFLILQLWCLYLWSVYYAFEMTDFIYHDGLFLPNRLKPLGPLRMYSWVYLKYVKVRTKVFYGCTIYMMRCYAYFILFLIYLFTSTDYFIR